MNRAQGSPHSVHHCIGRHEFGIVVQMRIDVGCSGNIAVAEPFLNLLHGDAVGQQQTGTAMTKIVIANFPAGCASSAASQKLQRDNAGKAAFPFLSRRRPPNSPSYCFCRTYRPAVSSCSKSSLKAGIRVSVLTLDFVYVMSWAFSIRFSSM